MQPLERLRRSRPGRSTPGSAEQVDGCSISAAPNLGADERRRNDDVLRERGTPHLGHVEHVLCILDRDSPRIGLDGVPELRLVAEPALGEAIEADLGPAGFALVPDRATTWF